MLVLMLLGSTLALVALRAWATLADRPDRRPVFGALAASAALMRAYLCAIDRDVLKFNGKLFKGSAVDDYVLPLDRPQIDGLLRAARANWREVEHAIFGTLLERPLEAAERHALDAHCTPRAYVAICERATGR